MTNGWHLPRVAAMLKTLNCSAKLQSAEDLLLIDDSAKWKEQIENVARLPEMKAVIRSEEKGIEDLKNGRYR